MFYSCLSFHISRLFCCYSIHKYCKELGQSHTFMLCLLFIFKREEGYRLKIVGWGEKERKKINRKQDER